MTHEFKDAYSLASSLLKKKSDDDEDKLVHYYSSHKGYQRLEEPKMASEMVCPFCGHDVGYTVMEKGVMEKGERAWICGLICVRSKLPKWVEEGHTIPEARRALLWPLFCELNGIGNIHHDVSFDLIDQSPGKIKYLREFAQKPKGILLMHGSAGTGKTYCCLGLCELYTRKRTDVKFFTHRSLSSQWIATFKEEKPSGFVGKLERAELLVVDDFGTSDPSPAFLTFFMDLINTRMQWDNRGTVITTNLSPIKLAEVCGEALSDRLTTGQEFIFEGKSRRKPQPL